MKPFVSYLKKLSPQHILEALWFIKITVAELDSDLTATQQTLLNSTLPAGRAIMKLFQICAYSQRWIHSCLFSFPTASFDYLSCFLNVLPYHLFDSGAVLPRRVKEQINICLQSIREDFWPPQVQIRSVCVWVHRPVCPRGGFVLLGVADFLNMVLWGELLHICTNEDELFLWQEASNTLPF